MVSFTKLQRLMAVSIVALGLAAIHGRVAVALDPAPAVIQAFYDALIDTMKRAQDIGAQGRFEKLAPVVQQTFDIPTMTRVACGPGWTKIPANQQEALVAAFARFTAANYVSQFNTYTGQRFAVDPETRPRNADLFVHSQLLPTNGDPVTFNYLMRGSGSHWKIEDVYLDGTISQLAVRRAEFTAILRAQGPDGLLSKLKNQSDGLLKGS